jgi:integrase
VRHVALDPFTVSMLRTQLEMMEVRADNFGCQLADDYYIFSDAVDGSEPWKPDAIARYFTRIRERVGLDHLHFHYLRKFMETYGKQLGFSAVQVALRAGHDPSVAAKHYTGNIEESDRALASAVASLLVSEG